jgi:hypothetical protein
MAVISDENWVRNGYEILGPFVHGEIKSYKTGEFKAAKESVSGPFEYNMQLVL